MFPQTQLEKIIQKERILSSEKLKDILRKKPPKTALTDYLVEKKIISEEKLYQKIAHYFKIPFIKLKHRIIPKKILFLIPEPVAYAHNIIAFEKENKDLKIATLDPKDLQLFEFIKRKTNLNLRIFLTTPSEIKTVLKQYHKTLEVELAEISNNKRLKGKTLEEISQNISTVKLVNSLLEYAIFKGASDIHIEPTEKNVLIRFRIDGILRDIMTLDKRVLPGVIARIKVLANLKIDEHRLPQDGRFKISTEKYKVTFRVSIIPVFDGEKVALRLLQESEKFLTLEQLGFQPFARKIINQAIAKPHGIILVTGPTGCGKTTTLYTILNLLNKPGVNICTIEDPIEYRIPGINQSQVNPKIGFTFATGLRSLLRQDPDIIMVGEIRDNETADIAINAAMTGHLVLSTLHTNNAVTALPRLLDMNVPAFLIASTVNIVIAQRLVRKICPNCKEKYTLGLEEVKKISKDIDLTSLQENLKEKLPNYRISKHLTFFRGNGCRECDMEGYKGRTGIYEILKMNNEIRKLVHQQAGTEKLVQAAQKQKMITMREDGLLKAQKGITTLEEILRVTSE